MKTQVFPAAYGRRRSPRHGQGATGLVPGSVAKWAQEFDDGVQRYSFDIRTSGTNSAQVR